MFSRLTIAVLSVLFACPTHARTAIEASFADTWMVDRWTVEDGLPLDHIASLALAPDGALWIASVDGLARFDGHSFRLLRRASTPALPSNRFIDIVALPDGQVWALTDTGDVARVDGTPRGYRADVELAGRATHFERVGDALWLTTSAGLVRLDGIPGPADARVVGETLAIAADGTRWLGGAVGVVRAAPGESARLVIPTPAGDDMLWVLGIDDQGTVWIGGEDTYLIRDGVPQRIDASIVIACALGTGPDGAVELRANNGLWRMDGTRATQLMSGMTDCRSGVSSEPMTPWTFVGHELLHGHDVVLAASAPITMVLRAPDGGVWVATVGGGLLRVRPRVVTHLPAPASWPRRAVDTLMVDARDVVWAGSQNHGLWRSAPEGVVPVRVGAVEVGQEAVFALLDDDGVIEVASTTRCRVTGSAACEPAPEPWRLRPTELIEPLLRDRSGQVWMRARDQSALADSRLLVRRGESWREVRDGDRSIIGAHAAAEAPNGDIVVTTRGYGLVRIRGDSVTRLGIADGLASDRLRAVWIDERGVVWLGTEDAGLCRWISGAEHDQVGCVGVREGLLDDVVHTIQPDASGRLWLSGNRGLSWVRRDMLDAVLDGRESDVLAVGLDERDGMAHREANGILPHASGRDSQGRLYFATQDGVARVDPRVVPVPVPPRVDVTSVHVAEQPVPAPELGLELDADDRPLAITWTANVLDGNRNLRFRYRLLGLDADWSRATTERHAQWLSLPPGELTLEIQAGIGGAWGPIRRVVIARQPTFVESAWFPITIALSALVLAALGTFAWSRRQRRARLRLEREIALATADLAEANRRLATRSREAAAHAARVIELDKTRTRFVADLSHELRTPLALVMGPLEDLAQRFEASMDDGDRRRLAVMRTNVARLEELNDQLLDVARLEAHQLPLRARLHDLVAFVGASAERFRPAVERKGLRLDVHVPEQPVAVYFDADLIDKVLSNLLGNALKFTTAGGITLELTTSEDVARVAVRDSGVGIPEGALPRLFERFYQVDRGDARRFEGVGIGLALVHDLVTLHGGEVGVSSALGTGSTFSFTLPRGADHLALHDIDPRPRATPEAPPLAAPSDGAGPEVLVVEDHPDMRAYLAEHLAERFTVRQADSGEAALAAVAERVPQAIVSDVMMPGMDGLSLCRALRADPRSAHVPVVLVSAKAGEGDRLAGLAVAADYLTKPVRPRELVARVSRLLVRPEPTPEPIDESAAPSEPSEATPTLSAADARHLARIEAVVASHLADETFGVNELASALALSPRQLQREVRRLTGRSPVQYLRATRMDAARAALRAGTRDTVAQVAADVGMSPAYFSRVYTLWFGVAPSDDLRA